MLGTSRQVPWMTVPAMPRAAAARVMMPPQTVQSVRPSLSITTTEAGATSSRKSPTVPGCSGLTGSYCTVKAGPTVWVASHRCPMPCRDPGSPRKSKASEMLAVGSAASASRTDRLVLVVMSSPGRCGAGESGVEHGLGQGDAAAQVGGDGLLAGHD